MIGPLASAAAVSVHPEWVPFVGPLHALQPVWYLLVVPFALLISMMWKAIRSESMRDYWRHVLVMWTLVILGLVALGILLGLLIEVGIPALPLNRP